jgi:hypothetical protein
VTEADCVLRAEHCDRKARAVNDRELRIEWSLLCLEWHHLASQLREGSGDELIFE